MNIMTAPLSKPSQSSGPWYREPYVWLVLGGPLVVIVASIFTIYLAVTRADPVLDRTPKAGIQVDEALLKQLSDEQRTQLQLSVMPAHQARNHAATPTLPKD